MTEPYVGDPRRYLRKDWLALKALQRQLKRQPNNARLQQRVAQLTQQAQQNIALRQQLQPCITFPEALPVTQAKAAIESAIDQSQVVIVAGETGSGKTTQLPKLCLALGRGVLGMIGHTQPRRIAARQIAQRVAEEIGQRVGQTVGYQTRFNAVLSAQTQVKVMTDGILLSEIQHDPWLNNYDTIILDEAHERSLNIDFLLGHLKQILAKRPDLKLIITSATIDSQRFSAFFAAPTPAPVLEVSGRLYPVVVHYAPLAQNESTTLNQAIAHAISQLWQEALGDVLVFLPGENEIQEALQYLQQALNNWPVKCLPLYARLSLGDQAKVFVSENHCRVILATNVAETSLTVPGIRYVVDTGLARIKRYAYRQRLAQLLVEKIAQSSANQRAGRCGRVADGVCVRLYAESDFKQRKPYHDPEIKRTSLAGVILQMLSMRLGAIDAFPFIDAPSKPAITEAYRTLDELGAIELKQGQRQLTKTGRFMAQMPLDPRIARMVIAARDLGCLHEVAVIAAALSVVDPRERPNDKRAAADQAHARFSHPESDFLAWYQLWSWLIELRKAHKSRRQFDRALHQHFLVPMRVREWRDTYAQIKRITADLGWRMNEISADVSVIHQALLAGLLVNVAKRIPDKKGMYLSSQGQSLAIHPSSPIKKKLGEWIMVGELVYTSRIYARTVATIQPRWLMHVAKHVLQAHYSEPHWRKKRGEVMVKKRVNLWQLVVDAGQLAPYQGIDPEATRTLFIQEALVNGEITQEIQRKWSFWQENTTKIAKFRQLEEKLRRRDLVLDALAIADFYHHRLPIEIMNCQQLSAWLLQDKRRQQQLMLQTQDLVQAEIADEALQQFPDHLPLLGKTLPLAYKFAPGADDDGVSLAINLADLNRVMTQRGAWLIPGALPEKVLALLKNLPGRFRSRLAPLPETVDKFVRHAQRHPDMLEQDLIKNVCWFVNQQPALSTRNVRIVPDDFNLETLSQHLMLRYVLVDDDSGEILDQSRDLAKLQSKWGRGAQAAFAATQCDRPARSTSWDFPDTDWLSSGNNGAIAALSVIDGKVAVRQFDTFAQAKRSHVAGLVCLFTWALQKTGSHLKRALMKEHRLLLRYRALGSFEALYDELISATIHQVALFEPWPHNAESFKQRVAWASPKVAATFAEIKAELSQLLDGYYAVREQLAQSGIDDDGVKDIEGQLQHLIYAGVCSLPLARRQALPRYLKAIMRRLERYRHNPRRDVMMRQEYWALHAPWQSAYQEVKTLGMAETAWQDYRWLLEELRVHLFAQDVKTAAPVSVKRLKNQWDKLMN